MELFFTFVFGFFFDILYLVTGGRGGERENVFVLINRVLTLAFDGFATAIKLSSFGLSTFD
ncbi:hypothetical protein BLA29_013223 [Euroglyphus maynei]|uniref:Uncharacterized protein n=1 Tax=Euroglyphus maynei TaxID=6958 RepID=A0A1Y3BHY2_EURMA|nr:hypothetical protein BLA29_013223 [Euroglyphus maynei]